MLFNINFSFFWFGFFIGIFWFYWIGLSFRYYNLSFLIIFIDLLIALFYGFIFYIIGLIYKSIREEIGRKVFLSFIFVYFFDYIKPFTFDWLKTEVIFANTIFSVDKISMLILFLSIAFINRNRLFILGIIVPIILNYLEKNPVKNIPLKIYLSNTYIDQDKKWDKKYLNYQIENDLNLIQEAIKNNYDVIILPESAFPLFFNNYPYLIKYLKFLSSRITIVTGGLYYKDNRFYNATFIFDNQKMKIVFKHILVPFGEYIPFPIFKKELNEIFFNGAADYSTSKNFSKFKIKNINFINAICYEATIENLYKLKEKYIIAISNNAWFMPSIEPSLQELLIKAYARRYKKVVFHSINGSPSYIINLK